MVQFSDKIAQSLRKARKIDSMDAIAQRCGVTRVYLYRVSSGIQTPSVDLAEKICDGLGLKLEISEIPEK
jgi:transcriptional regulator with XRE-family HTH domain